MNQLKSKKFWWLFGGGLVLSVVLFVSIFSVSASFVCSGTNGGLGSCQVAGWLWSNTYGWISLNSDNPELSPDIENINIHRSGVPYKVSVDASNNISGYGWSSNVGWVCFGSTCTGTPPFSAGATILATSTDEIVGVARVMSIGGDNGWIKLGNGNSTSSFAIGQECYDCQSRCDVNFACGSYVSTTLQCENNFSRSCSEASSSSPECDCKTFFKDKFDSCKICFEKANEDNVVGGSGRVARNCSVCETTTTISNGIPQGDRVVCLGASGNDGCSNASSTTNLYGFRADLANGKFVGWAWGGSVDDSEGIGWVKADLTAGIVYPWLETKYGSIYSSSTSPNPAFSQKSDVQVNNATYCLFQNGSVVPKNFTSSADCPVNYNVGLNFLKLNSSSTAYYNALGRIDVGGLSTALANGRDKYGYKVIELGDKFESSSTILRESVYVAPGNLDVGNLTFNDGNGIINGSGLVIVDGDLNITGNIFYGSSSATDLKKLASIAWIVKGDVVVSSNVTSTVGAFLVVGTSTPVNCDPVGDTYPKYNKNGCGVFYSVNPNDNSRDNSQLKVMGLIVAKAFDFRRYYASLKQGAERIIYDGRLIANPPPGLKSFGEGLPVIRDFIYNQ